MPKEDNPTRVATPSASLKELFVMLETPLLLYATKLVKNEATAQDIVQQAFLNLHPRMQSVENHKAWLYRTVHNLSMNHHRSQKKIVSISVGSQNEDEDTATLDPMDPDLVPDKKLEHLETIGLTRLVIEKLKPRQRELIDLKFNHDLSYKAIAAKTGLSISNVGYVLHQTLKTLALEMKQRGGSL